MTAPPPRQSHLTYLDGLRGLSALYVVLVHSIGEIASRPDGGGRVGRFLVHDCPVLIWGTYAVCVFIVLSGYCLMMPVAKVGDGQLRGGVGQYLRRRARRILPPYYAALGLSLGLIALSPLGRGTGTEWDAALPADAKAIVTHLLLIHNLTRLDSLRINAPLWSVATEWQIYFLFPLVLLPVWRRLGAAASVGVGLVLGVAPHYVFRGRFDPALPEMIALFALGMAAGINFSARAQERRRRELPWGALTLAGCALVVLLSGRGPGWVSQHFVWVNPVVGAAAACLLVFCTNLLTNDRQTPGRLLLRVLDSRPAVALGAFSYSLYLIHWPLLALIQVPLLRHHVSSSRSFVITLAALPVIVLIAYVFHRVFERPFMGQARPRTEPQAEVATITDPAP